MVPSSMIIIVADDERLTCDGFSLGETVRLGHFEFIVNYFSGLSLSHRRSDASATFMVSTQSGAPTPRRATIEDSVEEFHTTSSGEGSFGHPSPRRHDTGASLTPITTMPRMENAPATQATTTVPPWMVAPRRETDLHFE
jgi:hypothetical protein